MDNPEKTAVTINNGQSRENRSDNQQWTIQRKTQRQTRMDYPDKTAVIIKNGQSRENHSDKQECTIQRKPQ